MTQIETEFNWYAELDKAIESEPSDQRCEALKYVACNWVTCACGQLCKALPRNDNGSPEDLHLSILGCHFADRISDRNWPMALEVLDQIEARSTELLQEINQ